MRYHLLATLLAFACFSTSDIRSDCLVIAHRGASGYLPEHTLEAYSLAYGMNADVIEPDVVLTRDGVLICSHDVTIHHTAVMKEKFPERCREDGKWYFIDFDLAELRTIDMPLGRNAAGAHGMQSATLDEMILLIKRLNAATGRDVKIVPEAKAPSFHRKAGMPMERVLVETLARHGYTERTGGAIIQCFELESLRTIRHELKCDLPLVYLFSEPVTNAVLDEIATFVDGVGPSRKMIEGDGKKAPIQPDIIEQARSRGLGVYIYTFGNDEATTRKFMHMPGVTGVFTDYPDVGVRARNRE